MIVERKIHRVSAVTDLGRSTRMLRAITGWRPFLGEARLFFADR
jgi:hypothetical protein